MIELADLYAQYLTIQEEIDDAISETIRSTRFIGGQRVVDFEKAFATYTGAAHCIAVGNGTDALEIVQEACGITGAAVIVPAMTAAPTVESVIRSGNWPVFCDIGLDGTLDIQKISIGNCVEAIMPVHLYGAPAKIHRLLEITNSRGLFLIEDCAQAHGTRINGKHVGTFGIAGCFSFYPGKNLGAYGDAGAIITNNDIVAATCRKIRDHGRTSKYGHEMVGRNSRMDSLQAAILTVKLRHLDEWLAVRKRNARLYDELLTGIYTLPAWAYDGIDYSYHQYPILVPDRIDLARWLRDQGIATGMHYPFALPDLPPYQVYATNTYPVAWRFAEQELSLPVHAGLSEDTIEQIATKLVDHHG